MKMYGARACSTARFLAAGSPWLTPRTTIVPASHGKRWRVCREPLLVVKKRRDGVREAVSRRADEVLAGNEWLGLQRVLSDDDAAVRRCPQHPVPFEIRPLVAVDVEDRLRGGEVAPLLLADQESIRCDRVGFAVVDKVERASSLGE